MQNRRPPAPSSAPGTPRAAAAPRQTTNSAANPLKRLSLQPGTTTTTTTSNPAVLSPSSPGVPSPRGPAQQQQPPQPRRTPSSPSFHAGALHRSPSVASLNRSSSPALVRKSSTASLRGDVPGSPRSVSRRSSFHPNMPSPMGPKSPLPPPEEEKPPLRACDVAEMHFRKELARHEGIAGAVDAGTVVIVHDQCYGHRFSRPKTPKSTLSLIMERPERILASVLGISAAYVRLGERHAGGSHPPHPHHNPPERIPFKIRKTSRMVDVTSQVVTNVHGARWMGELKTLCEKAGQKLATTGKELARDAPAVPGQAPKQELHAGDLYLCPESLNAFQGALGGVLDAVDAVFQGTSMGTGASRAFVCIRPPGHHCSDDYPSGFCWLNNVHVGIEHAMMSYGLTHAAIIDFDLHHGDGSQAITWARNKKVQNMSKNTANWKKTSIGYFSLHDINSYPCEDGDDDKVQAASLCIDNAHGQSIWNVHLQPWKTVEEFWAIYEDKYMVLLDKTRQYLKFHTNRLRTSPNHPAPKSAIFISAGFDASEWETAGMQRHSVNVPTEFYARFTRDIVRVAEEDGTSAHGRVISVLEGGYSDRALTSGVFSHLSGLSDGQVLMDPRPSTVLSFDVSQRLGNLSIHDEGSPLSSVEAEPTPVTYDPLWWHTTRLAELEDLVNPQPVMPKKPKMDKAAHFSSPTQSFVAKVVDPTKLSRSMGARYPSSPSRAPTPPPPEVDWATAAQSLSKLLIPSDRQTTSHRPEDLAEPKVKKEKASAPALASVHVDGSGRQLRGRKAVATYVDPGSDGEKVSVRAESKADRRRTIANFPIASDDPPPPSRSVSRRMSMASSVSSIGDRSASRAPSVAPSRRRSVAPSSTSSSTAGPVRKARTSTAAAPRAPARPPVPRIPSGHPNAADSPKVKESDGIDDLTSGLKRIRLKMPTKEEHDAREREKEEKKKKAATSASKVSAPRPTARKAPTARAPPAQPATKVSTTKRVPSRSSKTAKPVSQAETSLPVDNVAPAVQANASVPLVQPKPIPAELASVIEQLDPHMSSSVAAQLPLTHRTLSGSVLEPLANLQDIAITPEQLREHLPVPSFVTVGQPAVASAPSVRADTPPPPPPSTVPQFVNYTSQSFDGGSSPSSGVATGAIQWLPPNTDTAPSSVTESRPLSPASKRGDLPVFSAHGSIPFASANIDATMHGPSADTKAPRMADEAPRFKTEEKFRDVWEVPDTPAK